MLDHQHPEMQRPHDNDNGILATAREQWPRDAQRAFREVLGELNRWCREHDEPMSSNAWTAEEAVRQTWADAA